MSRMNRVEQWLNDNWSSKWPSALYDELSELIANNASLTDEETFAEMKKVLGPTEQER